MKQDSPQSECSTNPSLPILESCCSSSQNPYAIARRSFIKVAGIGLVGTVSGSSRSIMAGSFAATDLQHGRLIPADKKLDPDWVRSLYERGTKEVYRGKCLQNIGMPIGGIGAGQLYLRGDGTLGVWNIFNGAKDGWGEVAHTIYREPGFDSPVLQGFSVEVLDGSQKASTHTLSAAGFREVSFQGEYPIATVRYADDGVPVAVEMEAFSPFIPLNAKDSALPATLFQFTLRNTARRNVQIGMTGWLENAVCRTVAGRLPGTRITTVVNKETSRTVLHSARSENAKSAEAVEPPIVFEDFEAPDYANWQVEGEAFGQRPSGGTAPSQGGVTGFQGKGLVNTFAGGDQVKGKLISQTFTVQRPYINLLVGGGGHKDLTCVNLVVDGKTLHSVVGQFAEHLTWQTWDVNELQGRQAHIEIVDQTSSGWGHVLVDQIEFSDAPRTEQEDRFLGAQDFGTMALGCSQPAGGSSPKRPLPPELSGRRVVEEGSASRPSTEELVGMVRSQVFELSPGESQQVTFVLSWHFPNAKEGNYYATRFSDAQAVADFLFQHSERLVGDTRLWRKVYYDSTLPYWLLDRMMSTVSTLATNTCQWWANGRFYAFEGVWCCPGTCTHVWNYAQAHARLFPELSRSVRELQDFNPRETGGGFHVDSGLVGFRGNDDYAADGQCGTVLKALREHQMSSDSSFLNRFWPRIKAALQYSINQDANSDGLIENSQHNTYDFNYEGPNTFVGSLYLAALRAGEEMAKEVGDLAFAAHCRAIYESGVKLTRGRLWNGEYFIQDVDLARHPHHQYGPGCLSDQVFGQGWAHQLELGYLYPADMVVSALKAVWKYNWAPDIGPYNEAHNPFRWFITPGLAGLFTCTWPLSEYLPEGTAYKDEVWSGIEYQVAGHMIAEGMVTEGLAICRAIHDRYQPSLFNPYNEIECGDHYARAMASWSVLLALAGYKYHGPHGRLGFAPRISPENFKSAFTAAEGWGTFEQTREDQQQAERIAVHWGRLRICELSFAVSPDAKCASAVVTHKGQPLSAEFFQSGEEVTVALSEPVILQQGESLQIQLKTTQE
jgi:uncharacterized protein (DUF608 family)